MTWPYSLPRSPYVLQAAEYYLRQVQAQPISGYNQLSSQYYQQLSSPSPWKPTNSLQAAEKYLRQKLARRTYGHGQRLRQVYVQPIAPQYYQQSVAPQYYQPPPQQFYYQAVPQYYKQPVEQY